MGERKYAAIIVAMFAAVLVMLAGKSCAENMKNERRNGTASYKSAERSSQTDLAVTTSPHGQATFPATESVQSQVEYVTDILGRVIGTVEHTTEAAETTTVPQVEYVTDILGRVIKTIEPTTEVPETTAAVTEKKNPLQVYQEQHSTAPVTRDRDIEEQHYTVPSTLHITIG